MVAIALLLSAACYAGAAALAAVSLARAVVPPVRLVVAVLAAGVGAHLVAVGAAAHEAGHVSIMGLGPALSFAGLALAVTLLLAETLAKDTTLALAGAPLAAAATVSAAAVRDHVLAQPRGVQGAWLMAHIALSFVGIAALAVAAAAGTLYLVERRELKSRRFGRIFRAFPPLETLDRVNHMGAIIGCLGLTSGIGLAATYSLVYGQADGPRVVWGILAWLAASGVAGARLVGGWRARRAAVAATIAFGVTLVSYLAARMVAARPGQFL